MEETLYFLKDTGHILTDETDTVASNLINNGDPIPIWVTQFSYDSSATISKPTSPHNTALSPKVIGKKTTSLIIKCSLKATSSTDTSTKFSDGKIPEYMTMLDQMIGSPYHIDLYAEKNGSIPQIATAHLPYRMALNRTNNSTATTPLTHLNLYIERITANNVSPYKYELTITAVVLP